MLNSSKFEWIIFGFVAFLVIKSNAVDIHTYDPQTDKEYQAIKEMVNSRGFEHISALNDPIGFNQVVQPNNSSFNNSELNAQLKCTVYTISYYNDAAFQVILYIFFGVTIEMSKVRAVFMHPIGPAVAFVGNQIFAPLVGYVLGWMLFADAPDARSKLFLISINSMGIISNAWTVIMSGNLELSISLTIFNAVLSCGMIPMWHWMLNKYVPIVGYVYFDEIFDYSFYLWDILLAIVALLLGYLIRVISKPNVDSLDWPLAIISGVYLFVQTVFSFLSFIFATLTDDVPGWKYFIMIVTIGCSGLCFGRLLANRLQLEKKDHFPIVLQTNIPYVCPSPFVFIYVCIFILKRRTDGPPSDFYTEYYNDHWDYIILSLVDRLLASQANS